MQTTDAVERSQLRDDLPDFRPGDTVKVHVRVVEGSRERIQVFQGFVLRRQGGGLRETFTVRKVSFGVGVERTFPVHSPKIERIEVAARGDVRRAKLYYLRGRVGKRARVRERRNTGPEEAVQRELLYGAAVEDDQLAEAEAAAEAETSQGEAPAGETQASEAEADQKAEAAENEEQV